MTKVRLAISTCPNDTFAFHALMHQAVDCRGLKFEVELLDIQQLNDRMMSGAFDVIKGSFFAALHASDRIMILPSGSALGFGVGPLLLAGNANTRPEDNEQITVCPGELTTAHFLFRLFYSQTTRVRQMIFSDIMPALKEHRADFGVCIHEGRFTWQAEGLHLVEDLGTRWERETNSPLPLGGIFGARRLGADVLTQVQQVILDSLNYANANPDAALPTMRKYATEFDDEVLMQHVHLYVNEWTLDLGDSGRKAIEQLSLRADSADLRILST
jgi:1,4-dihydroxy-6-naphthoate synthase